MDILDSCRYDSHLTSDEILLLSQFLMLQYPLEEGNNIPSGCILSVSLSRNSSAYSHPAFPPHIPCYPSPGSGCLPFLPASHSPLRFISSIRLSSCAPARIHEYSVAAANIPATARIPFILLHPFPYGELPCTGSYQYISMQNLKSAVPHIYRHEKTLTDSFRKRLPCLVILLFCYNSQPPGFLQALSVLLPFSSEYNHRACNSADCNPGQGKP